MLRHNKISHRIFTPNRLIFQNPDAKQPDVADAAQAENLRKSNLDAAVAELATSTVDSKAADQVLDKAIGKINAVPDATANPKTRAKAVELLKANKDALNAAKKYIGDRVTAKMALDDYGNQKDFWAKGAALKKIEATATALKTYKADDDLAKKYEDGKTAYGAEAVKYYDGLKQPTDGDIDLSKSKLEDLQGYMTKMASLQKAINEKFPGLDDTQREAYSTKFKADSDKISTALNSAPNADDDLKRQLKNFDFANKNLAGAEKEPGNIGHMSGAKEYMEMVLTEQEARGVWAQLPSAPEIKDSWRSSSIETAIEPGQGWSDNGVNRTNYNNAVELFNQAKALTANKVTGDSTKAAGLFKRSTELFKLVLANAQTAKTEKADKDEIETKRAAAEKARQAVEAKINSIANPKFKAYMEARIKPRMDYIKSEYIEKNKNYDNAKGSYEELYNGEGALSIVAEITKFNSLKTGAINQCAKAQQELGNTDDTDDIKKAMEKYLGQAGWQPSDVSLDLLKCVSGDGDVFFTGTLSADKSIHYSYTFESGMPVVTIGKKTDNKGQEIIDLPPPDMSMAMM